MNAQVGWFRPCMSVSRVGKEGCVVRVTVNIVDGERDEGCVCVHTSAIAVRLSQNYPRQLF